MQAICRKSASRRVTNRFLGLFVGCIIGLYKYVPKKATKKVPATTFLCRRHFSIYVRRVSAGYSATPRWLAGATISFSEPLGEEGGTPTLRPGSYRRPAARLYQS